VAGRHSFTDQGQSGITDASGRVFRLRAQGGLDRLGAQVPSPNGITLDHDGRHCYVAVTRAQQVWRLPIVAGGAVAKAGVAIQLSGGVAGPDGIESDAANGLLVCQLGVGVWRFDERMLPTHLVFSRDERHRHMANLAFGGPQRRTLYVVDSMSGDILRAELPVSGRPMYAHAEESVPS